MTPQLSLNFNPVIVPIGPSGLGPSPMTTVAPRNLPPRVTVGHADGHFGLADNLGTMNVNSASATGTAKSEMLTAMTGGPASDCSSMESCGTGGVLNRLGLGQRRDRIELVKVSTASSCLGGALATAPIHPTGDSKIPEQGPQTGGGTAVAAPEVAHGQERSCPLAGENRAELYSSPGYR